MHKNYDLPSFDADDKDSAFMEWGACSDYPSDLFFPPRGTPKHRIDAAKAVCATCPVRQECLDYARTFPIERFGIWGGMSAPERAKLPQIGRRPIQHGRPGGALAHRRSGEEPCQSCRAAERVAKYEYEQTRIGRKDGAA